eukprot:TRINITY_DN90077_c0_g1_i1.p1 TRINITY_DN90077_c0_g1~~TRINITY_DN90077_c0_g1_i1.p1  ORF type:complete len:270 (+),score=30.82 TRINITY_DN90077_c0_g1_i1:28-810(+)
MLGDNVLGDVGGDDLPSAVGPTEAQPLPVEVSLQSLSSPSYWSSCIADSQDSTVDGYKALSTKPNAPKFSLGTRPTPNARQKSRNNVPGPGSYITSTTDGSSRHATVPSFGFGTTSRYSRSSSRTPGPGAYSPRSSNGPTISITPRRKPPSSTSYGVKAPGPGAHILPDLMGQEQRGKIHVSMTPRRNPKDDLAPAAETPGPGAYDHVTFGKIRKAAQPKWGFGSARQRPREAAELQPPTPGPGSYRIYAELPHKAKMRD